MLLNLLLMPALMTVVAVIMALIPLLTRPDIYFAVTVDPRLRRTPLGLRCYRAYLLWVLAGWLSGLIVCAVALTAARSGTAVTLSLSLASVLPVLAALAGFIRVRRRLLAHAAAPAARRSAPVRDDAHTRLIPGPRWAHGLPYVLLAMSALVLTLGWDAIPGRFPQQLQADGSVGRWADKSVVSVFAIPLQGLATTLLLHAAMLIGRWVRRQPDQPQRTRAINGFLLIVMNLNALTLAYLALLPLVGPRLVFSAAGSITLVCLLVAMLAVPMLRYWRRIRPGYAEPVPEIGDRTPDRAWKLGLFYFNSDDPALWVEQRFGIGWTVNFARPGAWLFIAAILALAAGGLAISL